MDEERSLEICMLGSIESIHTRNRAAALAARGHRVTLVAPSPKTLAPTEQRVLRALSRVPKVKGLAEIYARLQHIRRLRGDVFHVQYAAGADAWLAAIAGLHPLVVSVWGGDVLFDEQGSPTPLSRRLTRDLLGAADLVTAESQRMADVVRRICPAARVELVHWGIDVERFKRGDPGPLRGKLGIPEGVPVLFSPKLLTPVYNIHVIVAALAIIVRQHPSIRLLISTFHADAAYRRQLTELAARLGVTPNVVFLPAIDIDDVAAVYGLSDLVITIPPSDGVPRTLMEAAACGVPSILADLPAYREFVVHGESAWLVPIAADAIADAVLRLLQDRELYARLRRNGLALAERSFDQRAQTARMVTLYRGLLAGPQPRSRGIRAAMLGRLLLHFGLHL